MTEIDRAEDLPKNAHAFMRRIAELVGRPVGVASVGPDRAQTIFLDDQLLQQYGKAVSRP